MTVTQVANSTKHKPMKLKRGCSPTEKGTASSLWTNHTLCYYPPVISGWVTVVLLTQRASHYPVDMQDTTLVLFCLTVSQAVSQVWRKHLHVCVCVVWTCMHVSEHTFTVSTRPECVCVCVPVERETHRTHTSRGSIQSVISRGKPSSDGRIWLSSQARWTQSSQGDPTFILMHLTGVDTDRQLVQPIDAVRMIPQVVELFLNLSVWIIYLTASDIWKDVKMLKFQPSQD